MPMPLGARLSRRGFLRLSAGTVGAAGAAGLMGRSLLAPRSAEAFPPDPLFKGVVRMCYHENPWGPHPAAVEAIREAMSGNFSSGGTNRYPDFDLDELKEAILRYNGLEGALTTRNVVVGCGSAEVLFMAADAFSSAERPFLTEWASYPIIIHRAEENRSTIIPVDLVDWQADLGAMNAAVVVAQDRGLPVGLIHFNVINNPAGTWLDKSSFRAFADQVYADSPNTVILCDDSDREYMDTALQPDLFRAAQDVVDGKPMIHVQTMSHAFGLTGLRVGYAFAREDIAEQLEAHCIFCGINFLGHAASLASLRNAGDQVRRCNDAIMESRRQLYAEWDAMGIEYLPSQGHYNLINLHDVDSIVATMLMYLFKKVFVRWGFEWDLDTWIRMCPSTEYENGRFNEALTWILGIRDIRGITAAEFLATTDGKRLARAAVEAGFPSYVVARAQNRILVRDGCDMKSRRMEEFLSRQHDHDSASGR